MKVKRCIIVRGAEAALALGLACGLLAASPCRAAVVRGAVHFPDEATLRRGGFWRVQNGVLPIAAPLHDVRASAVLVLTAEGAEKAEKADKPEKVELHVQGLRFATALLVAPPQAPLVLRNDDRRPLVLTLACPATAAETRTVEGGGQVTLPLPGAGLCALRSPGHGHLEGAVLIEAARSYSLHVDADGGFRGEVPEGRYQARLFWQGAVAGAQAVQVTAQGAELKFTLRAGGAAEGGATPRPTGGDAR